MSAGWETVPMRREVKQKLRQMFELDTKKPRNQSFNAYLDNIMQRLVDYHEKITEYGPFIDYRGPEQNQLFLFDNCLKKMVTIWIDGEKKKLRCELDDSDKCVHVGYCFGNKDIYEILIQHGIKPPKR